MRVRHVSALLLCLALASCASHKAHTVSTSSGLSYRIVAQGRGPVDYDVSVVAIEAAGTS